MTTTPVSSLKLTLYAFLGGVLWTGHFMLLYVLAEFGCEAGVTPLKGLVLGLTIGFIGLGLWSALWCWRARSDSEIMERPGGAFLTGYGVVANLVFTFIIFFQGIPALFSRELCP